MSTQHGAQSNNVIRLPAVKVGRLGCALNFDDLRFTWQLLNSQVFPFNF